DRPMRFHRREVVSRPSYEMHETRRRYRSIRWRRRRWKGRMLRPEVAGLPMIASRPVNIATQPHAVFESRRSREPPLHLFTQSADTPSRLQREPIAIASLLLPRFLSKARFRQ